MLIESDRLTIPQKSRMFTGIVGVFASGGIKHERDKRRVKALQIDGD